MEYDFIVNPQARSGQGRLVWNRLVPELKRRKVRYRLHETRYRRHARKIAEELTRDQEEHTIVVLGGDGTVNEVVNGICYIDKVTLGYIPLGSGNDFARGVGIESNPEKALAAVLRPQNVISMDVGRIELRGKTRRFVVSAGIGFDAAVCHEVCVSKWKVILNRLGLGKLSYGIVAMDRLRKDRPLRLELTTESGETQTYENTYFAACMNLPYEGGGFLFSPKADVQDGEIDVLIAHGFPKRKIFLLLPAALIGRHLMFRGVTLVRCKRAVIRTEGSLPIHTDGEPVFPGNSMEVSVIHEKLRVITGSCAPE